MGSLLSRPHSGQRLQAMGDEMLLGISYASQLLEGLLGSHWLLGVGEEPPLARES